MIFFRKSEGFFKIRVQLLENMIKILKYLEHVFRKREQFEKSWTIRQSSF